MLAMVIDSQNTQAAIPVTPSNGEWHEYSAVRPVGAASGCLARLFPQTLPGDRHHLVDASFGSSVLAIAPALFATAPAPLTIVRSSLHRKC
jgi:hypothetical protein